MSYRGFISYSQKNTRQAQRLHRALERYRVPRDIEAKGVDTEDRRLGHFFRDADEMAAAADIGKAVRAAIDDSDSLVVVCSPQSARSKWVQAEIDYFRNAGRGDRIYAVVIKGRPNSGDPRTECFPPQLRKAKSAADEPGIMPNEPVGIDIRKDGLARTCARIAAGVLGTPFDDLWKRDRRDARRRQRVRLAIQGGVAVVLAALAAGVYFTNSNLIDNGVLVAQSLAVHLSESLSAKPSAGGTSPVLTAEQLHLVEGAQARARARSLKELSLDLKQQNEQAGWSVAQEILGLRLPDGPAKQDAASLIQRTRLHGNACWPEYVADNTCHVAATSWVMYAMAASGAAAAPETLNGLLDLQDDAGWWPAYYNLHGDPLYAATYPTAWAMLAIVSQEQFADTGMQLKIRGALLKASHWLSSVRNPGADRWKDYPNAGRGAFSDGVSALAVVALNAAGDRADAEKVNGAWLRGLPVFPGKFDALERSQVDLGRSYKWDRTTYVVTPWIALSAAFAFADGDPLGQAQARVYLDRFLAASVSFTGEAGPSFFSDELLHCLNQIRVLTAPSPKTSTVSP